MSQVGLLNNNSWQLQKYFSVVSLLFGSKWLPPRLCSAWLHVNLEFCKYFAIKLNCRLSKSEPWLGSFWCVCGTDNDDNNDHHDPDWDQHHPEPGIVCRQRAKFVRKLIGKLRPPVLKLRGFFSLRMIHLFGPWLKLGAVSKCITLLMTVLPKNASYLMTPIFQIKLRSDLRYIDTLPLSVKTTLLNETKNDWLACK